MHLNLIRAAILVMTICASACTNAGKPVDTKPNAEPVDLPSCVGPSVKVVLLQDQTGSRTTTRTEQIDEALLDRVINLVVSTCGRLLVGAVRERSNEALVPLTIPVPPVAPTRPDLQNAFDQAEAMSWFRKAHARFTTDAELWLTDVNQRIDTFKARAMQLLTNAKLAGRSGVGDAINRADTALAEPEANAERTSAGHRYVVVAGDGISNTGIATPATLSSGAMVIVANGAGILGSLAGLPNVRLFEGLGAAIDHVTEREELARRSSESARPDGRRQ